MTKNVNQDNPSEVTSDTRRALDKIEYNRRHGKLTEAEFFRINPQASNRALSLALAMDQEKALARQRFGTNYTESKVKEEFKSGSALTAKKAKPSSFSRGGMVRASGLAKVHKGERVLTKRQAKGFR